ARPQRPLPDAALPLGDALAMAEGFAGRVATRAAIVADDDTHEADGDDRLGDQLDRGKPAVEEVGAVREGDVLPAAAAAGRQERLGILIVVVVVGLIAVVADRRGDDLAGR